jgi:16S rRNA (adenine1518-N6/adenine1519-N6)-dimethyltransferase
MAQSKREIEQLLANARIAPLKRFGQHFLIDGNLMRKLVESASVTRQDVVLEVGAGTGSLTELLLQCAGHVVAVEIDRGLQAVLRERLGDDECWSLLGQDVLATKSRVADEVLEVLRHQQKELGGRILLVANLPYQVATPLLVDLLMGEMQISPLCFTVQAEVAQRLMAAAGTKEYGPVSVYLQVLGRVKRIASVPAQAFWPSPKVESMMLRVDVERRFSAEIRAELSALVHESFGHRRKTLRWNLRRLLDEADLASVEADGRWDLGARPEQLSPADWLALAELLV